MLKEGGEFYFSDIYRDRRVPKELEKDQVLWGEGLAGALYLEDYRRLMDKIGFKDLRITSHRKICIDKDQSIRDKLGDTSFYSITFRAFKISGLEDRNEDYQQTATYIGGIVDFEDEFEFDKNFTFIKNKATPIDRNTALILSNSDPSSSSRYAKHFEVSEEGFHLGKFSKQSFTMPPPCSQKPKCGQESSCA